MSYKLIALDLDDTLLNSRGEISSYTLRVLAQAKAQGCYVVIATGRSFAGARRHYEALGGHSPIIVLTGADVLDENGKTIYQKHLKNEDALAILAYAKEHGLHAQVYLGDDYCFEKYSKYSDIYESVYGFPGRAIPDLYEWKTIDTPKLIYISEIDEITRMRPEVQARFPHLHLMRSSPYYLEFLNPETDKGRALKFLTEYLGLKREEVMAFGDSQIDSSMLEYAGLGVAVANAIPEVLDLADYICASNDEDGVAHTVEQFILNHENI